MMALSRAEQDVIGERRRQVDIEGWTAETDDKHTVGQMAVAGAAYAIQSADLMTTRPRAIQAVMLWPWAKTWWKPKTSRENLVRAAALLIADIERIDRANHAATLAAQPAFNYFRCTDCGFDMVQHAQAKPDTSCPLCMGGARVHSEMIGRTCLTTDKPEGFDARLMVRRA